MKKLLILLGIVFLALIVFIAFFGNVDVKFKEDEVPLKDSAFYKEYYGKETVLLVNVWSRGTMTLLHEHPEMEKFIQEHNIIYVSLSNSNLDKIKKLTANDALLQKYDATAENHFALKNIFKAIEFTKGMDDKSIKLSVDVTPYYVLIKDKKVYYKSNALDMEALKKALKEIKKLTV